MLSIQYLISQHSWSCPLSRTVIQRVCRATRLMPKIYHISVRNWFKHELRSSVSYMTFSLSDHGLHDLLTLTFAWGVDFKPNQFMFHCLLGDESENLRLENSFPFLSYYSNNIHPLSKFCNVKLLQLLSCVAHAPAAEEGEESFFTALFCTISEKLGSLGFFWDFGKRRLIWSFLWNLKIQYCLGQTTHCMLFFQSFAWLSHFWMPQFKPWDSPNFPPSSILCNFTWPGPPQPCARYRALSINIHDRRKRMPSSSTSFAGAMLWDWWWCMGRLRLPQKSSELMTCMHLLNY